MRYSMDEATKPSTEVAKPSSDSINDLNNLGEAEFYVWIW